MLMTMCGGHGRSSGGDINYDGHGGGYCGDDAHDSGGGHDGDDGFEIFKNMIINFFKDLLVIWDFYLNLKYF